MRNSVCATGRRSAPTVGAADLVAICALALFVAACSSTTGGGSSNADKGGKPAAAAPTVDSATVAATVKKAFLGDVPPSSLDPVVLKALTIASVPLTAEQETLLDKCITGTCETGNSPGNLTLGINADFSNNPFWNIRRAEGIAQASRRRRSGRSSTPAPLTATSPRSWRI